MKQKIITNTIIFIFVMAFVLTFKAIFGSDNVLIGITTITATLMLMQRDFTGDLLKNTLKFIGINLLMGVGTFIAANNMWLAIPINFAVVFTFSYVFTYNLRQPLYFPFGLQYLFLLSSPVSIDKLGLRLIALFVGALIIMLAQVLVNKNKLATAGNKILIGVCESIEGKLKCLKAKSTNYDSTNNVQESLDKFRTMIYDKRESNYYISEEARVKLNMSVALENINALLYDDNIKSIDSKTIDNLEELVSIAKATLKSKTKNGTNIKPKSYDINKLLSYYEEKNVSDLLSLQIIESMIFLDETTTKINQLDKEDSKEISKASEKSEIFSKEAIKDILKGKNSPKYCYAMRMAISITIGAFIMNFFKLAEGRWILFTILSLTNPIYEIYKSKVPQRIVATLIGGIIIVILFTIFKGQTARLLIVMACGYLQSYVNEYKYRMIFITVCAIGTAAVVGNIEQFTIERILMVILGSIIAIIANKYIFPYKLKNSNEQLRKIYYEAIKDMFEEIDTLLKGNARLEIMNNLFVITSLVESKSRINKEIDNDKNYSEIVNIRRCLASNIYELYRTINKAGITYESQGKLREDVKILNEYQNEDISSKIIVVENSIKEAKEINTKIILSSIVSVLKGIKKLNELNKLREQAQI